MSVQFFLMIVWLALLQSVASAGDSAVVKKWLAGQAGLKSLTADFKQERVLREGKRPIVSEGKFTYAAPGSIRWQMGDPAVTLAVQKKDGDLTVANVRRKKATVYPLAVLKDEEAAMGFSFIEAGFPKTLAEFNKNFTVTGEELKDGVHHVTVKMNNKRVALGLRKMIFYVDAGTHELRGFYLRFRDSGSITTRFSNVRKNPAVPKSRFEIDLSGYKTEIQKKK